jgi:hypothetical protein
VACGKPISAAQLQEAICGARPEILEGESALQRIRIAPGTPARTGPAKSARQAGTGFS